MASPWRRNAIGRLENVLSDLSSIHGDERLSMALYVAEGQLTEQLRRLRREVDRKRAPRKSARKEVSR